MRTTLLVTVSSLFLLLCAEARSAPPAAPPAPPIKHWPMYGRDPQHTSCTPVHGPAKPTVAWKKTGKGEVAFNCSPIVGPDGTIYLSTSNRGLIAFTPAGAVKWNIWDEKPAPLKMTSAPALASDGTLYAVRAADQNERMGSSCALYAVAAATGRPKWHVLIGNSLEGSPVVGPDGTVYVCGSAFNAAGSRARSMRMPTPEEMDKPGHEMMAYAIGPDGRIRWSWKHFDFGAARSSPALTGEGDLIFAGAMKGIFCLDAKGKRKWQNEESGIGQLYNSASVGPDGTAYVAGAGKFFYALDRQGQVAWKGKVNRGSRGAACAITGEGEILSGDESGTLYCFLRDGTLKWKFENKEPGEFSCTPAVAGNGLVYVTAYSASRNANETYHLYAVRLSDGSLAWKHPIGSSPGSPAIGPDGTLYAVSCLVDHTRAGMQQGPNGRPVWRPAGANSEFTLWAFKP